MGTPLLDVHNLTVVYGRTDGVYAVRDVNLTLHHGEFLGLVGESGCGKSTLAYAIARLIKPPAHIAQGTVTFREHNLLGLHGEALRHERWEHLAVVLQSGMNALNPLMTIERQFFDVMSQHTRWPMSKQRERVYELLEMVHVERRFASCYPHQLSGGMKQRVAIALSMILEPELIIMDEPTTALDVVVQRTILDNLMEIRKAREFAVIFVSHDLGLVLEIADRVAVMYAGEIVEAQPAEQLYAQPLHPYTRALLKSVADPDDVRERRFSGLPGHPPDLHLDSIGPGCPFYPRCTEHEDRCRNEKPTLSPMGPESVVSCWIRRKEPVDA